jgi:protein O-mannosyl-transferase
LKRSYNFEMINNKKFQFLITGLVLIILVLITYQGAFKNDFVDWDDYSYVINNDLVRNPGDSYVKELFTTPVSSNYHPLTILSMRLNNNVCATCPNKISAAPFIWGNVILHILNTLLVLIFVYLVSNRNILVSFLVAAVFGLHPMHAESVAWIAERKDVLYTFFFLSGLIAYLKFLNDDRRKHLWLLFSFFLFLLSCLSKATAVVFPVVLILLNFFTYYKDEEKPVISALKKTFSLTNISILLPFFIVSLFIGMMAYRIQSGENFFGLLNLSKSAPDVVNVVGPFSILQRFEVACYGFVVYIIKFFVPVNFSAIHPYPAFKEFNQGSFAISLILSVVAVILIAIMTIRSVRKTRLYVFGLSFYFITVGLVLQFITVGIAITAERYSYLPYVGLSIIPATLIAGSTKAKRIILLIISGCFIVMCMIISRQQVKVWANSETLWTQAIDRYPHLELPRRSRGKYYSKKSLAAKREAEIKMYEEKALVDFTEAIKAGTKSADVFQGTGVIYASKGDLNNAIKLLNIALSIDPKKGAAYYNRALVYDRMNKKEEAIKDYNMALIYNPDWALQILNNRSNLFLETGRFKEAAGDFDYLIFLKGNNYLYYSNRAYARLQLKDVQGAISDYRKALELKPDDQLSRANLQKLLLLTK